MRVIKKPSEFQLFILTTLQRLVNFRTLVPTACSWHLEVNYQLMQGPLSIPVARRLGTGVRPPGNEDG